MKKPNLLQTLWNAELSDKERRELLAYLIGYCGVDQSFCDGFTAGLSDILKSRKAPHAID